MFNSVEEDVLSLQAQVVVGFGGTKRGEMTSLPDQIVALRPRLFGCAMKLCRDSDRARDLVQDTFERALSRQHQFEPGTNLGRWLIVILYSIYFGGLRQRHRRPEVPFDLDLHEGSSVPDQEAMVDLKRVLACLDGQPRARRESLILYSQGWFCSEIAEKLGIPIGSVKSGMSRTRAVLEKEFG